LRPEKRALRLGFEFLDFTFGSNETRIGPAQIGGQPSASASRRKIDEMARLSSSAVLFLDQKWSGYWSAKKLPKKQNAPGLPRRASLRK
jgi:hypothetical protein